MNFNEQMAKALAQARELQQQMFDAANQAGGDLKPQLAETLRKAQELQKDLQPARNGIECDGRAACERRLAASQRHDLDGI